MSTTDKDNEDISTCVNCGKEGDDINKLKSCTACKLVKYCSRECQIAHRPQHKKECRKRAAELHDKELFKQPPPAEDCSICFLRIPTLRSGYKYMSCCGKVICCGCCYAPLYDNQGNKVDNQKCPFCRTPSPKSIEEENERLKKRMEVGDPIAMYNLGVCYGKGRYGLPQDHTKALELLHRAAELGHAKAYLQIGDAYEYGDYGVEVDKKKAKHYLELASMIGDVEARYYLGLNEKKAIDPHRALKHYMIAVESGDTDSLEEIKQMYTYGFATKEDYTKALQSYQSYLGEIKSSQRDKAAAFSAHYRYY